MRTRNHHVLAGVLRCGSLLGLICLLLVVQSCYPTAWAFLGIGTTYYVDCSQGNDHWNGTSPQSAWRDLARANSAALRAGDQLLLRRGCVWNGPLRLTWNGSAERPIVVSAYGTGELPVIQQASKQVIITGSHLVVEYLSASTNAEAYDVECANQPVGLSVGFSFEAGATENTLRYSMANGLTRGVQITKEAHHNHIFSNTLFDNTMMSTLDAASDNDSGAHGVLLEGDDNEVAYNTISGHDACSYDYERDGAAIEVYGGQRNNIHHNRADNNNTFVELGHARSKDNSFAYNLVTATIYKAHFLVTRGAESNYGPVAGTLAYNNTVYLTDPSSVGLVCEGFCQRDILTLKNTIIWSEGIAGYADNEFDESHNIFWRTDGKPEVFFPKYNQIASSSQLVDPGFVAPESGDFHLAPSSPAIDAGAKKSVEAGYTVALDNVPVPQGVGVDIGAFERGSPAVMPMATPSLGKTE